MSANSDAHAGGTSVNLWHADFSDTHTGTVTQKTCCYKCPLFWTGNVSATLRGLPAAYVKTVKPRGRSTTCYCVTRSTRKQEYLS
ncbi:UNVERIFIED_CONTAM: hypothetical protein HHA_310173 [Hammondia hammondi]|eukprot:XP_008886541.1 hypothetical protein HHA_310173 [Hammondia hammondi]